MFISNLENNSQKVDKRYAKWSTFSILRTICRWVHGNSRLDSATT